MISKIKTRNLALRAQDVEGGINSLQNLPPFAGTEFKHTFLAGQAARLAAHISGADVFQKDDIQRLEYVGSSLGINPLVLPRVLELLQEADCIQVQNEGSEIVGVREFIPQYVDLYEKVGEILAQKKLSEVEQTTLASFDLLVESPKIDDQSLPIYTLEKKFRVPLLEIVDQASLIRRLTAPDNDPIIFAPQYWDENYEETTKLLQEFGDGKLKDVYKKIQSEPGLPIKDEYNVGQFDLVTRMAQAGMLPSPVVNGLQGPVPFAFTPYKLFDEEPAVASKLMEKVRALLACVRYGQHFGTGSKIRNPGAILWALKVKKRLAPHSDAYSQYRMLYDEGLVRLERSLIKPGYFVTIFIDTDENLRALDAAIHLLEEGVPVEATINQEIKSYAKNATYDEPTVARAKRSYFPSKQSEQLVYSAVQAIITT